jgi:c-di-GMP-binding flagellar brake protein YcgR
MERRNKTRIDVTLTCWINAGHVEAVPVKALTENISRTGILMHWGSENPLPAVDSELVVDIQLPENSEFGPRIMRCRTTVVRAVELSSGVNEVALKIQAIRIVKAKTRKAADLAAMPMKTDRVN